MILSVRRFRGVNVKTAIYMYMCIRAMNINECSICASHPSPRRRSDFIQAFVEDLLHERLPLGYFHIRYPDSIANALRLPNHYKQRVFNIFPVTFSPSEYLFNSHPHTRLILIFIFSGAVDLRPCRHDITKYVLGFHWQVSETGN